MSRRGLVIFASIVATLALIYTLQRLLTPQTGPAAEQQRAGSPAAGAPQAIARTIVVREADELLDAGRPWRAARVMREHLERRPDAAPAAILLAARAEAGWGGWDRVRTLLDGETWLDGEATGEGWFLLARAREAAGDWSGASDAYGRYLQVARGRVPAEQRAAAEIRHGVAQLRAGELRPGVASLRAAQGTPDLVPWLNLVAAEALAAEGDTASVGSLVGGLEVQTFGRRAGLARVRAAHQAGDPSAARRLAQQYRAVAISDPVRAEFSLEAARAALALQNREAARADFRAAVTGSPGSRAALDAARGLEELGELSPADRLAVATVYDRRGQKQRAAAGYRAWLASGAGSAAERQAVQLRLGRALFDAGDFAGAERVLRELASTAPTTIAAEALYLAGRAQSRRGDPAGARATYLRVAERFPRTQPGAEALYLVADSHHDAGEMAQARQIYRRVASEWRCPAPPCSQQQPGADRAGLALMRLGGMAFLNRDHASAAQIYEEYRATYPDGPLWPQATYWAGRSYEQRGDRQTADARYREVRLREPLSYYSLRSAERLGGNFWPVQMEMASPPDQPAVARQVEDWMRTLDLLRAAGLEAEAEAEADRLVRQVEGQPQWMYPLAEALNERGYAGRGIRLGLRMQRGGESLNPRLLRILYPFPYRQLIEGEAVERGLDPFVVAALTRQESTFEARISSPAGARGLMQVMPGTGRAVARGVGISSWDDELLFQPEINVHLGTRYLADQMRTYGGSLPLVFSAYNAGPHQVERWRRYPEYGDEELFTERIPFRETRDYVKILTRNIEIYRGLYGAGDAR